MKASYIHRLATPGEPELAVHVEDTHNARALVVIVPGLNDHAGRHAHTRAALRRHSFVSCSVDLRGHGSSGGHPRHVNRFDDFVRDVIRALEFARQTWPRLPLFLLGHSMGGLVSARVAAKHQPELTGLILSSAALRLSMTVPPLKLAIGRRLSRWWPRCPIPLELDFNRLSRDPAAVNAAAADTLSRRSVSARLGAEMLEAIDAAPDLASAIRLPLFLFHGSDDAITAADGSEAFCRAAASEDKTFKLYLGCLHEMHNELAADRDQYLDDLTDWIGARARLPPGQL